MKQSAFSPWLVGGGVLLTLALFAGGLYFAEAPFRAKRDADPNSPHWQSDHGDPVSGQRLFAANCAACHQEDGRGKPGLAPSIRNRDFLALASDAFIRATIQNGRSGTAMLPRPDLDEQGIADIVSWLRDLPVVLPAEVKLDPRRRAEGDVLAGKSLFHQYCSPCHGLNGQGYSAGGAGPAIGMPGFLDVASDDYIIQTVIRGRTGTAMRPFRGPQGVAALTDREIDDIVVFLRTEPGRLYASGDSHSGPPDPAAGQNLFAMHCAPCHQAGGVGKPGLAPSIRNRDFLAIAEDDFIRATVVMGREGTAMAPRPDLEGASLEHIIAYLRALPVANPLTIKLDQNRKATGDLAAGRTKFATYCASCHGPKGEGYAAGGSGPGIGLAGFLQVASDDYIIETAKQGRVGTPMKPFIGSGGLVDLEESDIEDIIVYLRSLNS